MSLGDLWVVKSNALVKACYSLSLNEQRLMLSAIAQLDSRRPAQKNKIRIYADEFKELFNLDAKNAYSQLKTACDHIWERTIVKIEGKTKEKMRWIYTCKYHDGEGYIEMGFAPEITPYLTSLGKQFTKYKLNYAAELKSPYTLRLLELVMSYRTTRWCEISVDDLKQMMMLEAGYDRFYNLRTRIIDPAIKELKEKLNITITFEVKTRMARKPHMLRFSFPGISNNKKLKAA